MQCLHFLIFCCLNIYALKVSTIKPALNGKAQHQAKFSIVTGFHLKKCKYRGKTHGQATEPFQFGNNIILYTKSFDRNQQRSLGTLSHHDCYRLVCISVFVFLLAACFISY